MNIAEIAPGVTYVGVNDRTTPRFEQLWPLPYGVSYNSYLVRGNTHTVLIDSVEIGEATVLADNLARTGVDTIDYLVVNHMEPDHSGSIPMLLDRYPTLKVVCNKISAAQLSGFYGINDPSRLHVVADDDTLDLGGLTLRFITTPMVHWPETMMTFCPERRVLFTGDAFGCFGALNGKYTDRELTDTDLERYFDEMYRYYAAIVAKYGRFVQNALKKTASLGHTTVCPTHGPVWHRRLDTVSDIYDRLSRYEPEVGAVVVFGSMYGHTAELADRICEALARRGVDNIRVHNAATAQQADMIADCVRYGTLVIGSVTYSGDIFPPVATLLRALRVREIKNRTVGTFGSFTWAMGSLPAINKEFEEMGITPAASLAMKQAWTAEMNEEVGKFADSLCPQTAKEEK